MTNTMPQNINVSNQTTIDISDRYVLKIPSTMLPQTEEEMALFEAEKENEVTHQGMDSFPVNIYNSMLRLMLADGKLRNVAMIICQANWGMRFGDLVSVKVSDIINADGSFKSCFSLVEHKTEHTRKVKKARQFYNNRAVCTALLMLFESKEMTWNDYLFTSNSSHKVYVVENDMKIQAPMTHTAAENVIKDCIKDVGIKLVNAKDKAYEGYKINTHSLRKLYGNMFTETGTRLMIEGVITINSNMLELAMNDFGHSSMAITQRYVGQIETLKRVIVNEMNIGIEVLDEYQKGNI